MKSHLMSTLVCPGSLLASDSLTSSSPDGAWRALVTFHTTMGVSSSRHRLSDPLGFSGGGPVRLMA